MFRNYFLITFKERTRSRFNTCRRLRVFRRNRKKREGRRGPAPLGRLVFKLASNPPIVHPESPSHALLPKLYSFSDQMPQFFISFAEVDQLGV